MNILVTNSRLGELVSERPSRARVLEKYGLDYCCHGKRLLDEVCAERHIDLSRLLRELLQNDEAKPVDEKDWRTAPLGELADHIVATHHAYLYENLPRLRDLISKVCKAHSKRHPELSTLSDIFTFLYDELMSHTMKEEAILFPLIHQLESATTLPAMQCGSVNNPIHAMEYEHDIAGEMLAALRALTNDYTPPQDACNTYRVMLDGLAELEADLHLHIHKENNILFSRAAEREVRLTMQG